MMSERQTMQSEVETVDNPVVALYTVGLNSSDTLYDKLNGLAEEIKTGILNLSSSSSLQGLDRRALANELEALRDASYRERSPEAVLNILLFRKYADMANQIKDSVDNSSEKQLFINAIGDSLPSFVYKPQEGELVGWNAIQSSIFWLRILTCIFVFISYVVMSSVKDIAFAANEPAQYFLSGCKLEIPQGSFNYRPYQAVIAIGVIVYLHGVLLSVYYWLPLNAEQQKFIPGLSCLLGRCMEERIANDGISRVFRLFKTFLRAIELISDGVLLLSTLCIVLVASILLERGSKFSAEYFTLDETISSDTYYTIGTFYTTFKQTSPLCLNPDLDPAQKIRASLGMMYLAVFTLALCFLNSLRSFRIEMRSRVLTSSQNPQGPSAKAQGMGVGAEGEEFRALPLPTRDDEETV